MEFWTCRAPCSRVSVTQPLIDRRSPVPSGKPRATPHIRRPLIQYSHVQPCSRLPIRQTACLACVSISGHLQFYTMLSDQSVGLALTGHRTACCVPAALSGHVWTIQHGCHRSIPGVCSRWLMAFTLEPQNLYSPENRRIWTAVLCDGARGLIGTQMEDVHVHRYALFWLQKHSLTF